MNRYSVLIASLSKYAEPWRMQWPDDFHMLMHPEKSMIYSAKVIDSLFYILLENSMEELCLTQHLCQREGLYLLLFLQYLSAFLSPNYDLHSILYCMHYWGNANVKMLSHIIFIIKWVIAMKMRLDGMMGWQLSFTWDW